jgi:Ca2+-transporting ATPase
VPIAGMALLPILFKMPLVLLPAHIAFLELIIDPACSTVFEAEPEEKNIMNKPPRDLKKPLFDKESLILSLTQGLSVLAVVFVVFLLALFYGKSEIDARTLTFTTLVIANILLIISNLSLNQLMIKKLFSNNIALRLVIIGAILSLALVLYVPVLRSLFHFSVLHFDDLLIASFAGIISVFWSEIVKLIRKF